MDKKHEIQKGQSFKEFLIAYGYFSPSLVDQAKYGLKKPVE